MRKLPAVAHLRGAVEHKVKTTGHLIGLDKRVLPIRNAHAALNTLLQGAGAAIAKQWILCAHRELEAAGYVHGRDFWQLAWVHDEMQIQTRKGEGDAIGQIVAASAARAGEELGVRMLIEADHAVGQSWADTH